MGWIRYIHFIAAFAFGLGLLVRVYWFFAGNPYASWRDWFPVSRERWRLLWKQLKYYIFLERERPRYMGHNPVAGLGYAAVGLMILIQGIIGLALYAESYASGFWQLAFGWLLTLFSSQTLRLIHHAMMWLFGVFFIVHIYMAVLEEVEEGEFSLSAIVSGVKYNPGAEEEG
jgi:Ni/Fe-hydrogenase 1 B-type cytochrome subunit